MWMFSCLLLGPILAQGEDPSVANGELTPPDLPFPPMPSKAVVGPTLADSVNSWPPKRKPLKEDAPNILLIMNDDVGYGAPETFGGPIHTPTLSKVARHWCLHTWCHLLTLTQGFLQPFPHHGHLLSHPCVPADWAELPQRRCWADHRGGVGLPWRLGAQGSEQCKFDMGWEKLRNITFEKQKAMGWIPNSTKLTPIDPTMVKWEEIPEEQRAFQLRLMEVYAGYLEHTDTQDGKVVEELERQGLFNNTLIIYVLGDNGASAEGIHGTIDELLAENALPSTYQQQMEVLNRDFGGLDALGSQHVDKMYHSSWAWALDTPFKSTKLVAAHFGGMRTPMVMSWPKAKKWKKGSTEKVIKHDPTPRSQFHHVCDIAPTIYEAVGVQFPTRVEGAKQMPLDGVSMVYTWNNVSVKERKSAQYFEVMGSQGVYKDGWFASVFGPRIPWAEANETRMREWNPDTDVWELYDLTRDFSQAEDLAKEMPDQVAKMKQIFLMEATANKVLPIGAGLYTIYYHPEEGPHSPLTEWKLYEGLTRIAESNAPGFHSGQNSLATIDVEISANASGVLYCVGGTAGGFSVYMDNGYLYAEYMSTLLYRYIAKSTTPLQPGTRKIQVRLIFETTKGLGPPADLTLFVDGQQVGWVKVEKSIRLVFDASETFDVGMDLGSPVSLLYQNRTPFKFNGKINLLHVKYINGTSMHTWWCRLIRPTISLGQLLKLDRALLGPYVLPFFLVQSRRTSFIRL